MLGAFQHAGGEKVGHIRNCRDLNVNKSTHNPTATGAWMRNWMFESTGREIFEDLSLKIPL
jgi:hypothetical protein